MSDEELIAQFLATRGATKCAPDTRDAAQRRADARRMYAAVRGESPRYDRTIRMTGHDHLGREIWVNAEGEFHSYG